MEILTPAKRDSIKKHLPEWIEPTQASTKKGAFSHPDWLFERKFDGVRCLVFKQGNSVRLMSRSKRDITNKYQKIADALLKQKGSFIADGEIVTLQYGFGQKNDLSEEVQPCLYLYDMIHGGDYDLTDLKLRTRKEILNTLLDFDALVRYSSHVNAQGEEYFRKACEKGWAGIVAKNINSTYEQGHSRSWLEIPCEKIV